MLKYQDIPQFERPSDHAMSAFNCEFCNGSGMQRAFGLLVECNRHTPAVATVLRYWSGNLDEDINPRDIRMMENSEILKHQLDEWADNNLSVQEEIELFQYLCSSSLAWVLGNLFSKRAHELIASNDVDKNQR